MPLHDPDRACTRLQFESPHRGAYSVSIATLTRVHTCVSSRSPPRSHAAASAPVTAAVHVVVVAVIGRVRGSYRRSGCIPDKRQQVQ